MRTPTRPAANPALAALLRCAAYRNAHKPRSRYRNPSWQQGAGPGATQGAPAQAPLPVAAPVQPATMPSPCHHGSPYRPARWVPSPRTVGRPATPVGMPGAAPSMPHNGANHPCQPGPRTLPAARATGPLQPAPNLRTAVARPP